MYADDVFCHIEWDLLFMAPWTGSPDGRVPITGAPTVRAPLCMCMCSSMNVDRCKYIERERESNDPLCVGVHFCLYVCRAGPMCVCGGKTLDHCPEACQDSVEATENKKTDLCHY